MRRPHAPDRRAAARRLLLAATLLAAAAPTMVQAEEDSTPLRFSITRAPELVASYTGRVYVLFGSRGADPRNAPGWFSDAPFLAVDVVDWRDGPIEIGPENAIAYPDSMATIPERIWNVMPVIRLNPDTPRLARGAGNAIGEPVSLKFDGATGGTIGLVIDRIVPERRFGAHERVRRLTMTSDLLSEFHGREILMKASVILPPGYEDQPERRWPVEYWIGGFGSDETVHLGWLRRWDALPRTEDIARVVLDPRCFGGHHVFADSANNGPRGTALVRELIPRLESEFRFVPARHGRVLSGHSSGGWSSLWLQVAHPETFGGTWSLAPDPVDFRAFQNPDIYAEGTNMYVDAEGAPIPVAHRFGTPFAFTRDFDAMERVYGEGGQLRSFEWVFSPRGDDGLPRRLWSRETGAIDPEVAEAWRRYDIRLLLEENWADLGPKLAGAIHVFCGDQDTFYLCPAVRLLGESLERLGSDAVVEIHAGKDHGSVSTPELAARIRLEMLATFERGAAAAGP